jgi:AcrR family transcriptional regulator
MQDIADALGTSRPALYHYFSSKDEILARLIDGLADSAERAIDGVAAFEGPADRRLHALVTALIGPIAESPGRFRLIHTSDATMSFDTQGRMRLIERKVVHAISDTIAEGIKVGLFKRFDQRIATFTVLGMINWVAWWHSPADAASTQESCKSIADLAVASLLADGTGSDRDTPADVLSSIRRDLQHLERLISE